MRMILSLSFAVVVAGCSPSSSAPTPVASGRAADREADHAHERDKMKLADAGPYHAALTAHLSKDGNELDVFIETAGAEPKPVGIADTALVAKATRAGDPIEYTLTFDPAPAEERPTDEAKGTCSHFVAKAEWLKPDDVVTVKCEIEVQGKRRPVVWKEFVPKKYAHHDDSEKAPPMP